MKKYPEFKKIILFKSLLIGLLALTSSNVFSINSQVQITSTNFNQLSETDGISSARSQIKKVVGTVIGPDGAPLPGASILIKGSAKGTISDSDGKYAVTNIPDNAVLVFTFIGMETMEIPIKGRSLVNVKMVDQKSRLDEVVVTALGIKRAEKAIGYSTQQVGGAKMAASGNLNAASSLSGEVAGLTVSNPTGMFQTPSFSLRGNTPLIVVDGIPVETDFFDISSDNIENINVLKGTAAAALYGSRGKNGAIMITTKTAKKEGLEVSITSKNMFTAGYTLFPETQSKYGSGSHGEYEFWDGEGGGKSDDDMEWGPKLDVGNYAAQWNSPIRDKVTGETIDWWGSVTGTKYDDKSRYERVPMEMVSHDNLRDFLQEGFITNNNVSIAYKGKQASFVLEGQYAHQRGQAPTTSLNTGGINFNSTVNLTQKITLKSTFGYNIVSSPNYPDYGYHPSNYIYTIVEWMGADVNGNDLRAHQWVPGMEGYRQANYNYAWYNNPYFAIMQSKHTEKRNVFNGQVRLDYQIMPGFNIMGRASVREKDKLTENKIPKSYMNYGDSRDGDYKVWNVRQTNVDADVLATYKKEFLNHFAFTVNAGSSIFYRDYRNDYISTDGLTIPGIYSITNSTGPIITFDSDEPEWGARYQKEIRSVYGSANLDFSKYAYLTVTGRNDWSSTLAKENNSYFYPSVSLSTVVSDYITMPQMINFLKLYGSWTTVSSDLDPYQIIQVYSKLEDWGSTTMVEYSNSLVNYNIKPQKTTSSELGLSTAILRNRISLDVTYYHALDENQILDMEISQASGFGSRKINGNVYTTNGWEVMAGFKPIQRTDFKWSTTLNWSKKITRLTSIYGGEEYYGYLKLGDRIDEYFGTVWQHSADGQLIVDATGMPIKDSFARSVGHMDPDGRFGWQNTFKYKDFTLNFNLDGAYGGIIYSRLSGKLWWGGKHINSTKYRDEEYSTGNAVYVPDAVTVTGGSVTYDSYGNVISDTRTYEKNTLAVDWQSWCQNYPYRALVTAKQDSYFANIYSRSYVKLRYLGLTYNLKKALSLNRRNRPISDLSVTLYGNNLFMLAKAKYIDPDISGDNSNDDGSADPTARYVGMSVNVKF